MRQEELRERAEALRWFHTIDLGHGIVTKGVESDPESRLARLDLPPSLAGLSVLDVGAWDGYFSFEAERRGAARVVAADFYSWHGPGWGSKAGFELAHEALGSKVESVDIDVMDLSPERIGTFRSGPLSGCAVPPARSPAGTGAGRLGRPGPADCGDRY